MGEEKMEKKGKKTRQVISEPQLPIWTDTGSKKEANEMLKTLRKVTK